METAERDRAAKYEALVRLGHRGEIVKEALDRITQAKNAIQLVVDAVAERKDSASIRLREGGAALKAKLDSLSAVFVQPSSVQGFLPSEAFALSGLLYAYFLTESSLEPPTPAQQLRMERAERALAAALERFNRVFAEDVAAYRRQVEASGFQLLGAQQPLTLDAPR
jgi:hypothetical protein